LITNAHVEWLDVDGLPLAIRKNVSRIPVTPGNLFVEQLTALPIIHLMPESFKDVLVISALKQGDPIKRMFEIAFGEFEKLWKGHIHVHFKEVATEKDLREAFGEFSGPLVIFDGHGSHAPNEAALLHLIDEPANIWNLSRVGTEVPPIVILSACDTHAADRNHATTANAFLALGARAVLSSVFPLSAPAAAAFVARLLHRVANFLPAAIGMFDRALTWTEVVSGMIRMQLLTDFLRLLLHRKLIDESMYEDVHTRGNYAINGGHEDPFGEVISVLSELGVDERKTRHSLEHAVANSSAISYLHVGRPETIIIDRQDRMAPQLDGDLLLH
jgi:hypothetical protein